MTYSVEYIVQTASFEHVLWKIEEPDIESFEISLGFMHAGLLEKMGQLGALSKGAVSYGYANPDSGQSSTEELIKTELKAKVLSETENPYMAPEVRAELTSGEIVHAKAEAAAEAPSRPWKRQPEVKPKKEWEAQPKAATVESDDFFD